MAAVIVEVKKKGSAAAAAATTAAAAADVHDSSSPPPIPLPFFLPLPVPPEEKIEAYKKACEEDSDDDEEAAQDRFNAMLEDMYGLTVMKGGPSIKESNEALTIKMEMPGLGEEDVKVSVVNQMLVIKAADESKNGNNLTLFVSDDEYKSEDTKAVMENGVLTVVVPKIKKPEEIKDASTHDAVKD